MKKRFLGLWKKFLAGPRKNAQFVRVGIDVAEFKIVADPTHRVCGKLSNIAAAASSIRAIDSGVTFGGVIISVSGRTTYANSGSVNLGKSTSTPVPAETAI
jgi:hypothetical protein